ncbi:hypothetical protein OG883_38575 [Streptomyces sp. NBC_01142]|nr:hypothetical protein [Streptomyces sp. NBC_01142]MCX4825655.1 hypothetical protein [Streptomyces sp. NBC_01142]
MRRHSVHVVRGDGGSIDDGLGKVIDEPPRTHTVQVAPPRLR